MVTASGYAASIHYSNETIDLIFDEFSSCRHPRAGPRRQRAVGQQIHEVDQVGRIGLRRQRRRHPAPPHRRAG